MAYEKEEFFACDKKNCRFFAAWTRAWNEFETVLACSKVGRHNPDPFQALLWCLLCKHFNKPDNFIELKPNDKYRYKPTIH